MSWWVYLQENDQNVMVERHSEGGTYAVGGIYDAEVNITYNYSPLYYKFLNPDQGLRWLNGKQAKDCIEKLEVAVEALGTGQYNKDYWAPMLGNAGHALNILLGWAKQHPDATFLVS